MEALLQTTLKTDTAMRNNSSSERLGLKDVHALRPQELDVPLVINTDALTLESIDDYIKVRMAMAQRGLCEPRHTVNTQPIDDFLTFLQPNHILQTLRTTD